MNCCEYSFTATPGWDASTGLGSPVFNLIADLVLNNATEFIYIPESSTTEIYETYDETDDSFKRRANTATLLGVFALLFALLALFVGVIICWKSGIANGIWNSSRSDAYHERSASTGNDVIISPLLPNNEKH